MRDCSADLDLARRAATGDQASWRRIFDATSDSLFALLCYQVGDREEALDLLQETYLQAFRRLADYRGDAPFEAWLRVIALRKAIDWKRTALRRLKRTVRLTETSAVVDPPDPDLHFESERLALREALAKLSGPQRAVFLMREWEGWSYREIAGALGCGEGTARVRHGRARARLRRILDGARVGFAAEDRKGKAR